ncbi:MAG: thioredoxin domain-containing protein [Deltaproteobacteria bacterium]|nr:thioredoxin domain-containing protein [Deltaproteobacteria bacterium]
MAGHPGARTEIIVFSDFQCSFCKKAAREIRRLLLAHPNRLKVYYKHYPLAYHPYSRRAAQAAEAARLQGKFWEMHDLLFAHAEALDDVLVYTLAKKLKLDMERLKKDMDSPEVIAKVNADKAEGERLKIRGTPSFFINRRPFNGSYMDLQRKI